jgi:hypothetical protein
MWLDKRGCIKLSVRTREKIQFRGSPGGAVVDIVSATRKKNNSADFGLLTLFITLIYIYGCV